MKQELLTTDILIIGGGIAGATAALVAAQKNPHVSVTILTRSTDTYESNTFYAQGGIIAKGGEDLFHDIMDSGDSISLPQTARILADEGPTLVRTFLAGKIGVPFDTNRQKQLVFALEGGHREARVAKVADATGRSIEENLMKAIGRQKNIRILTGMTAVDLLTTNHHAKNWQRKYESDICVGVYGFDQSDGKVSRIRAKKTILATGGAGQMYAYTTNPRGARGDGIAMAYRAGAKLLGLEFVQFHPTALTLQGAPAFLISESVRGAGARLTNHLGRPFMQRYYPKLPSPDLATRDKVSRAIFLEMLATGAPNVYLDLRSYISPEKIREDFPMIYTTCRSYGIDITKELIPVSPAAHYMCGGVSTDLYGRTTIANLYAIGEVANTGLHGGNRLASTSLLEGLVFGKRAAEDILSQDMSKRFPVDPKEITQWKDLGKYMPDTSLIASDVATVQSIMWNMVGLVRKTRLLARAITDLTHMEDTVTRFYREAKLTDDLLGLRNIVLTSLLVAKSAMANTKSIGCHYREE